MFFVLGDLTGFFYFLVFFGEIVLCMFCGFASGRGQVCRQLCIHLFVIHEVLLKSEFCSVVGRCCVKLSFLNCMLNIAAESLSGNLASMFQ